MRKTIRIMMWFLRKLYQCDKKRFGSMAALIVIRAITFPPFCDINMLYY